MVSLLSSLTLPGGSGQLRHLAVPGGGDCAEPPDGAPHYGDNAVWHAALSLTGRLRLTTLLSRVHLIVSGEARIDVGQEGREGDTAGKGGKKEESVQSAAHGAIFSPEPLTAHQGWARSGSRKY